MNRSSGIGTLLQLEEFGDLQSKILFDRYDFAPCDWAIIDEQVYRLIDGAIELHDRTGAELENLCDGYRAGSDLNTELQRNMQQQTEVFASRRSLIRHSRRLGD
jgi:hypothetical protein